MEKKSNFTTSKWDVLLASRVELSQLREGNTKAIHEAIETLLPLAKQIIGYWCKKFPYYYQEIESEGYYALTKAVTTRPAHPNLVGYCRSSVEGRIRNIVKDTSQFRVPRNVQDKMRAEGNYVAPELMSLDVDESVDKDGIFGLYCSEDTSAKAYFEFCCDQLILDRREKIILTALRNGENFSKMSRLTGLSRTACRKMSENLIDRLTAVASNPEFRREHYGD